MAVSGCPRNCSEATCKDVGVICVESGFDVHFAGAAGLHVRQTDLLCKVATEDECLETIVALTQLYREQGRYLERMYKWSRRVSLETIRTQIMDDEPLAQRFSQTIQEHGPESVALYVSGQILTEDYYVANKLMKGFIGAGNIDTNSRLCMASSVAGHRRAFGADMVPGHYGDFDEADLVVLVGSNLAWCHPVLYQRLLKAKEARGTKIIVIDPRATASCEAADLHLPLAPDSDVALFLGLLARLEQDCAIDTAYVHAHTSGVEDALAITRTFSLAEIAALTGLEEAALEAFYALWSSTQRVVTIYRKASTSRPEEPTKLMLLSIATC